MANDIKKILIVAFVIMICLFMIGSFIIQFFIIKGFSVAYIISGIVISGTALSIFTVIKKLYENHKVLMSISVIIIISITFLACFVTCGIKEIYRNDEHFYSLSVDGLSEECEVILYEYNAFLSNSGCLCVKVNDFIYKKIPGTHYTIESGHSLTESGNLILDYNSETGVLTMKYTSGTGSGYIENTTTF